MPDPERIAIIGLGLIGGSLALSLRRSRPNLRIIGVDVDVRAREQALEEGAVDAATWLNDAALEVCDAVVLCTPAKPLLEMIPLVAERMREGAVLTDVCGSKERICARGGEQDRVVFVGAHPMAGTEYRGFVAANPSLFAGCTVAHCPPVGRVDSAARSEAVRRVQELWLSAGAEKLLEVNPAEHDKAITFASHLPYLAATGVVEMLLGAGDAAQLARELAAGGFRDTTRLAGDGTVGGAAALNRFAPVAARALADKLRQLADEFERTPDKCLERLASLADERRRMRLPSTTGGSSPLPRPR
jgi:prephenate dehydrogenase